MENQNNKKSWLWIGLAILLILGGFFGYQNYWSSEARENAQLEKQYQNYLNWEKGYKEALKNDTFGGKTPQETLDMFVAALRAGDTELASKYFVLKDGKEDSRLEWKKVMDDQKNQGGLEEIIRVVSESNFDENSSSGETAWFVLKNKDGLVEYSIILKLNKESGIWKIESL